MLRAIKVFSDTKQQFVFQRARIRSARNAHAFCKALTKLLFWAARIRSHTEESVLRLPKIAAAASQHSAAAAE